MDKPSIAGRIFHLHWLPFPVYRLLFFKKNIGNFGLKYKNFRLSIDFMHHSPIDSSFTWIRIYLTMFKWWACPVVIVSGYQPNCGISVNLFHKEIFNNTKWAKRQLWLREGSPEVASHV